MTARHATSLPTFVVIGAPKSGTTSLYYYLRQHPDVYLPVQKELHYFSYACLAANARGPGDRQTLSSLCASRAAYERHYAAVRGAKAIGDISPSYLYYGVQDRIMQELSPVKIVAMLRNPADKAFSQYMHLVRDQRESLPFLEALRAEDERRSGSWSDIWRYAESSLYADRLRAYIDRFGRRNVHVIIFDDFIAAPQLCLRDLFDFLEIDASVTINTDQTYNRTGTARSQALARFLDRPNALKTVVKKLTPDAWRIGLRMRLMDANTAGKPAVDDAARRYLAAYFGDDITKLEQLLGRALAWR